MPADPERRITQDQAMMWLNDRLGQRVQLELLLVDGGGVDSARLADIQVLSVIDQLDHMRDRSRPVGREGLETDEVDEVEALRGSYLVGDTAFEIGNLDGENVEFVLVGQADDLLAIVLTKAVLSKGVPMAKGTVLAIRGGKGADDGSH